MQRKMYTAFVSSVSSLKEERRATLDVLLDLDVFPVATEHFVIQSKDGINDIERLIDDSDFFILLMVANTVLRPRLAILPVAGRNMSLCTHWNTLEVTILRSLLLSCRN